MNSKLLVLTIGVAVIVQLAFFDCVSAGAILPFIVKQGFKCQSIKLVQRNATTAEACKQACADIGTCQTGVFGSNNKCLLQDEECTKVVPAKQPTTILFTRNGARKCFMCKGTSDCLSKHATCFTFGQCGTYTDPNGYVMQHCDCDPEDPRMKCCDTDYCNCRGPQCTHPNYRQAANRTPYKQYLTVQKVWHMKVRGKKMHNPLAAKPGFANALPWNAAAAPSAWGPPKWG